jgi:hypothetical protein
MFGVDKVTSEMIDFCAGWAEETMPAPREGLQEVDVYFRRLWDLSHVFSSTIHTL